MANQDLKPMTLTLRPVLFPLYHTAANWEWGGRVRGSSEENPAPHRRMGWKCARFWLSNTPAYDGVERGMRLV